MDKAHLQILMVDDSPEDQEKVRRFLKKDPLCEYQLLQAYTGEEGLELCRTGKVDCILLDYRLPDMDGLEFMAELEAENKPITVPIVFLTGTGNEELAVKAMKSGAADYLVKDNLATDLLARAIQYAMERKRTEKELQQHREHLEELVKERTAQLTNANQELQLEIGERKRTEEALGESEVQFRTLFESSPTGIGVADQQGDLLLFNDAMLKPGGYSAPDIQKIGNIGALYHDPEQREEALKRFQEQGFLQDFPVQFKRKDGSPYDALLSLTSIHLKCKPCIQAIVEDVTERKRAEETLRRSERKYRQLVETLNEGVWVIDKDAYTTFVNPRMAEMLGYSVNEMQGKHLFELMDEDEVAIAKSNLERRQQGITEQHDFEFLRKDGTKIYTTLETTPLTDADGNYIGAMAGVMDITERVRVEAEQNRIFDMPALLIMAAKSDSTIVRVSAGWKEVFGYSPDEMVGSSFLDFIHPDDVPESKSETDNVGDGKVIQYFENRYRGIDGQYRTLAWAAGVDPVNNLNYGVAQDITERKQAEKSLRESEQRYHGLFDSVPIGLYRTTPDGKILDANPSLLEILGYPDKEAPLKLNTAETYINGEDWRHWQAKMKRDGAVTNFEAQMRRRDGTAIWVRDNARAVYDADHQVLYYDGSLENITVQKRASEKIIRQSKVLEGINKVFRQALTCETDEEVAYVCLSVAEELTGSKFGLIGELNQAGLFHTIAISNPGWDVCTMPDSKAGVLIKDMEIRGIDRSTIKEGKSRIVNDPASHPDRVGTPEGHPQITSFLGVPLKRLDKTIGMIGLANKESGYTTADQEAIENLSIAFLEALDHKRAEGALNREREKFQVLVEESPLGVSLIGKDGAYKYANPKFVDLFGYTLDEIPTGQEWFRKAYPDKEYRNQVISAWINLIKETKVGPCRPQTFTMTCKDGSKKVIQFSPVIMKTGDQFVIYEDITKEKKLEAQLVQSQKMEAIGRLAGGVAHDFNNLMTSVIGNAELVLMSLTKDDPLREDVEEIKKAGDRATALTRQLLAFSRKQVLQPMVLNLNTVLADTDKMLRRLIGEDLEIATILEQELGNVNIDPGQMEQVVMNLAINARDAMPGGGKLTIETSNVDLDREYAHKKGAMELEPGPYVMLAISDKGIGMDKETQAQIFDPFFTTKAKGKGTGLGLSTVYGIIKQSGGYIWIYSEPGQGTTFKIYLPRVQGEEVPLKKEDAPQELLQGSETVLIVEDDKAVRNFSKKVLKRSGYNILEAQDGEEALMLSKAHEGHIDLLLTDMVMPKMSGKDLADRLLALRPETKVLFMSGYTDNAIIRHGTLEPDANFLQKPFTPEILTQRIRKVLDQRIDDC